MSSKKFPLQLTLLVLVATSECLAAPTWSVDYLNSVTLDTSGREGTINELSGVSYMGPSTTEGRHSFIAALEDAGELAIFDVEFAPGGSLVSAAAVENISINSNLDYEGIVTVETTTRVFLSEETTPGVREFDLATGNEVQSVAIPEVFNDTRNNRGFESLTRSADGNTLWTANEEALSVDGPISSTTGNTTVRLQQFDVNESTVTAGAQYAYEVEPVHSGGFELQRGLSELVELPDGTLLGLERSFASFANPAFESAIFEVDYSEATDVSVEAFEEGLSGQTFTPVVKYELWSGQAGASIGENLEGLTLVQLEDDLMILLGVTDNEGLVANTIVAFEISLNITGDFDNDGDADGSDFLTWQRNFNTGTTLEEGDANQDGTINGADLGIWEGEFGSAVSASTSNSFAALQAVPEPTSLALLLLVGVGGLAMSRRR